VGGPVADAAVSPPDPAATLRSKRFLALLVLASLVGVAVSIAAWGFLELLHYTQEWVFTDIPRDLGYDSTPLLWYPPVLAVAGLVAAFAIVRLPGGGGHVPAYGLNTEPTQPIELPGVFLAALASIGLGLVVGPEAPLIAIGGGLGIFAATQLQKAGPEQVGALLAAAGAFSALGFLFGSPLIAAVLLIEATGLGGPRLPLVLVPGMLASGIGSLTWIGLGSLSGLSTGDISISSLELPAFPQPELTDFGWTILLAAAVAVATFAIFRLARETHGVAVRKPFLVLPVIGLAVSGLAIGFSEAADKSVSDVLFSGEDAVGGLVANPGGWSLGALALLIACKGIAYGLSLGSFRGGPVFPALFLGAAAGLMAAKLPGFALTPAVAVGIGAAVVSVLRLPLSAVVLAILLTSGSGAGAGPLVIVGVVVAYLVTLGLSARQPAEAPSGDPDRAPAAETEPNRTLRADVPG
jgi:H+/Cl- antiporter ClcA